MYKKVYTFKQVSHGCPLTFKFCTFLSNLLYYYGNNSKQ
jgi:hypothetical protein